MNKPNIQTTKQVVPMLYGYSTPEVVRHNGWTKIGYTEQDVETRINQQTHTADVKWHLEWKGNATFDDGSGETFIDKDFHAYLRKSGIEQENGKNNEWFHVDGTTSKQMFRDFREDHGIIKTTDTVIPYKLREEQQEIYRLADKYSNVYIITSCRTTDSSAFMKINTKYRIKTYEIPDLAKNEIDKVAKSYPIILSLQQNKKYSDLLCVPFYLNLIVSGGFVEENINDENNFRNLIWERIICLKDKCKKYGVLQSDVRKTVERIVFERASRFVVGVDSDIVDSDILEALKSEGIIVESRNKIRLKYDIFEDICFERYIDKAFDAYILP